MRKKLISLTLGFLFFVLEFSAIAAQRDLQKLTVGYIAPALANILTPVTGIPCCTREPVPSVTTWTR